MVALVGAARTRGAGLARERAARVQAAEVGKGKGRQKPLQKRIKLMLSGTRSEQEEEDELRSEEDKNHEISHDFA